MKTKYLHAAAAVAAVVLWCAPAWSQTTGGGIPANAVNSANHYRDTGLGPAQGRSGTASLSARALLAKDGSTQVELTTGTLDTSATPPGNLDKVQYKPLDPNGNAYDAQNWNGLTGGGYYTFTTSELASKQQLQLQSNISGIDKRTDVVTVVETVKLRPDLAVESLSNIASAYINQPVIITANVVELNGDTGANADCVLAVDGANVDQAQVIWVDAGGSVSCMFSYQFAATGTHSLQVTAANVVPTDWDTGNNSATGSINIVNPGNLSYDAGFSDGSFTSNKEIGWSDYYNGGLLDQYQNTDTSTGWEQTAYINFWNNSATTRFQYPMKSASWTESMDGAVEYSQTGWALPYSNTFTMPLPNGETYSRQISWGYAGDVIVQAFSLLYTYANGQVAYAYDSGTASRNAGDVTYYSNGFECALWWYGTNCQTGNYYSWNNSSHSVWGTRIPVGSKWTLNFSMTDNAGTAWTANATAGLSNSGQANWGSSTPQIWSWGPDLNGYSGTNLQANWGTSNMTSGTASSP